MNYLGFEVWGWGLTMRLQEDRRPCTIFRYIGGHSVTPFRNFTKGTNMEKTQQYMYHTGKLYKSNHLG
jgi:hypothetical protein